LVTGLPPNAPQGVTSFKQVLRRRQCIHAPVVTAMSKTELVGGGLALRILKMPLV
jgi:hypothetical protein